MSRRSSRFQWWTKYRPHFDISGLAWAALLLVPAAAVLVIDQAFSLLFAQRLSVGDAWPTGSLGLFGVERLDHAASPLLPVATILAVLTSVVLIQPYVSRAVRVPLTLAAALVLGGHASFAASLVRSGVVHDFLTVRTTDADPLGWLGRTIANGNGYTVMHTVPADLAVWGGLLLAGLAIATGICEETIGLARRALPLPGRRCAVGIAVTLAVALGGLTAGAATSPDPHRGLELTATSIDAHGAEEVVCAAEGSPGEPVTCSIPFGGSQ